jgi:hypothetical protein
MSEIPLSGLPISAHLLVPGLALAVGLLLVHLVNETATQLDSLRRMPLRLPSGSWLRELVHPWVTTRVLARAQERQLEPRRQLWTGPALVLVTVASTLVFGTLFVAATQAVRIDYDGRLLAPAALGLLAAGVGLSASACVRLGHMVRRPGLLPEQPVEARVKLGLSHRYGYGGGGRGPRGLSAFVAVFCLAFLSLTLLRSHHFACSLRLAEARGVCEGGSAEVTGS